MTASKFYDMHDKERILLRIIQDLSHTHSVHTHSVHSSSRLPRAGVFFNKTRSPVPGDIVVAQTGYPVHRYTLGVWVESTFDGGVVREFGSDKTCTIHNESFSIIDGLHLQHRLEGTQRKIYEKIEKALRRIRNSYGIRFWYIESLSFRCKSVDITLSRSTPWAREKVSVEFTHEAKSRTTIRSLVSSILDSISDHEALK